MTDSQTAAVEEISQAAAEEASDQLLLVCWPAAEVSRSAAGEVEGSAEEPVAALKTAVAQLELVSSAAQAAEAGRRTAEAGEDAPEVGTAGVGAVLNG